MTTTYVNAVDELFTIVNAVLTDTQWAIRFGYTFDVRWPGDARSSKPDVTKLWARVSCKIVTDGQYSLANANGEQFYEAVGLLFVQLFCPRNQPATLDNGRGLAVAIQRAFYPQSLTGELWFRRPTVRELSETDESYPINVVIEYRYKTAKSGATNVGSFTASPSLTSALGVIPFTPAPDGIATVFTLSFMPSLLLVFSNGVLRRAGADNDYTISGNTITMLGEAPASVVILGG